MSKVDIKNGLHTLIDKPKNSSLWNKDLDPTDFEERHWHKWNIMALWIGMAVSIPTYMLGSGLISKGMNWEEAIITIFLGCLIVLLPLILIGHAGTKYGIPFPVFLRASFGTQGARVASLLRAIVACGWFGIQSWIGGAAIYQLLLIMIPNLAQSLYLGSFIGLNIAQFGCFLLFWIVQVYVIHHGINSIRYLATFAAPILIVLGIALLLWCWIKAGSFAAVLHASYKLGGEKHAMFGKIFWPGLTSVVGYWATLALNIPDFTRFARSQSDQALGQAIGLPFVMLLYTFIGIFVTSASIVIFGKALWNPVLLIAQFKHPLAIAIAMLCISLATVCSNLTANVVSPANDFSNLFPDKISFRMGGYITALIGIVILPWKLIADSDGYIYRWLIAYSSLLGAVGGVMICDYYVLRRAKLALYDLFVHEGEYLHSKGWNWSAFIASIIAVLPNLPGFLVKVGFVAANTMPHWLISLYDYAWFISFAIAFVVFWFLMSLKKR